MHVCLCGLVRGLPPWERTLLRMASQGERKPSPLPSQLVAILSMLPQPLRSRETILETQMSKGEYFKALTFTPRKWQNAHDEIPNRRAGGKGCPIFIHTHARTTHRQVRAIQAPIKRVADVGKKKTQWHWGNILNITILKTPVQKAWLISATLFAKIDINIRLLDHVHCTGTFCVCVIAYSR